MAKRNGFDPVFISVLKIVPLDISKELDTCPGNAVYSWAVFTSATAASLFFKSERLIRYIKGAKLAAVGSGTARSLQRKGLRVDFIPSEYTTEKLAEELPANPGSRVLILRSKDGNNAAEEVLGKRGIVSCRIDLYRASFVSKPVKLERIRGAKIAIFGSSKEVMGLENRLSISGISEFKKEVVAAPIGPLTGDTAMKMGYRVIDMPKAYTYRSLFEMLGELKLGGRI